MNGPAQLTVSHLATEHVHRVTAGGEVDYLTAPRLAAVFDALPVTEGTTVEVDLAEVPYCDSAGLAVLVRALHRVTRAGGRLRLVAVDPRVRRTLETTGLAELFGGPG
ncbi:STAS domain-containing protein [Actinokineospora guangxiensis]|uniref:Anti-sigma factor antagonist n=1 Tax=Actinokineospora guangxiensis TaxID=1490288 RepID=A0ABW0EQ63_9PSEU